MINTDKFVRGRGSGGAIPTNLVAFGNNVVYVLILSLREYNVVYVLILARGGGGGGVKVDFPVFTYLIRAAGDEQEEKNRTEI